MKHPPRPKIATPPSPPEALVEMDELGRRVLARISIEGTATVEIWDFDWTEDAAKRLFDWLPKALRFLERLEKHESAAGERRRRLDEKRTNK